MKIGTGVMIAMICINAGAMWVEVAFTDTPFLTPINGADLETQLNATELAGSYAQNPADGIVDITAILTWIWDLNFPFIEAFWSLLTNAGFPIEIIRILKWPYRFIEVLLLAEIVRNTDLTGV